MIRIRFMNLHVTRISLLTLLFCLLIGCSKDEVPSDAPSCIQKLIHDFSENDSTCDGSAFVREYRFEGEVVYAFDPGNCGADFGGNVYTSDCDIIGFLGGITGNTKINGVEFSTATLIRVIWSN